MYLSLGMTGEVPSVNLTLINRANVIIKVRIVVQPYFGLEGCLIHPMNQLLREGCRKKTCILMVSEGSEKTIPLFLKKRYFFREHVELF